MVLCGNCKQRHATPADVKSCFEASRRAGRSTPPTSSTRNRSTTGNPLKPWKPYHAASLVDPEAPTVVYLMFHVGFRSLKVGVTSSRHIEEHQYQGWELIESWLFNLGFDALEIEELVLDRWRNLFSLRPSVARIQMPEGGHSETAVDSADNRADSIALIEEFHRARCEPQPSQLDTDEVDPWELNTDDFDPWDHVDTE